MADLFRFEPSWPSCPCMTQETHNYCSCFCHFSWGPFLNKPKAGQFYCLGRSETFSLSHFSDCNFQAHGPGSCVDKFVKLIMSLLLLVVVAELQCVVGLMVVVVLNVLIDLFALFCTWLVFGNCCNVTTILSLI